MGKITISWNFLDVVAAFRIRPGASYGSYSVGALFAVRVPSISRKPRLLCSSCVTVIKMVKHFGMMGAALVARGENVELSAAAVAVEVAGRAQFGNMPIF